MMSLFQRALFIILLLPFYAQAAHHCEDGSQEKTYQHIALSYSIYQAKTDSALAQYNGKLDELRKILKKLNVEHYRIESSDIGVSSVNGDNIEINISVSIKLPRHDKAFDVIIKKTNAQYYSLSEYPECE